MNDILCSRSPSLRTWGRRHHSGFTLIELLIVIAILGVLAAVLLPRLLETKDGTNRTTTQAHMLQIEQGIKRFELAHGYYPTDDLKPLEAGVKADWKPDNNRNTAIESLVCFLSQSSKDGAELGSLNLTNTDGDDHGVVLPLLSRRERLELADAWNTPFAYFSNQGFEKAQIVVPAADVDGVQVKCKRTAAGVPMGARKYQLLSAGKDLQFGTDDDLVWPEN